MTTIPVSVMFVSQQTRYSGIVRTVCYGKQANENRGIIEDAFSIDITKQEGPIVAHPPCRYWGNYSNRVKITDKADRLGFQWSIDLVRKCGGVIEHPAHSRAFFEHDLSGFRIFKIYQSYFGHPAKKETWIAMYSPFLDKKDYPTLPCIEKPAYKVVENLSKIDRELTPYPLCVYLVGTAMELGKGEKHYERKQDWPFVEIVL